MPDGKHRDKAGGDRYMFKDIGTFILRCVTRHIEQSTRYL